MMLFKKAAQPQRKSNYLTHLDALVALDESDLLLPFDRHDPDAEAGLQRRHGLKSQWFIIAPCFPRSERTREEINLFYFNELKYEVDVKSGAWIKALLRDLDGAWSDEPGFLVVDPDPHWIMDLARRCLQDVLVACRVGEAPRVIRLST